MLKAERITRVDELVHAKKSSFISSIMLNNPFVMEWYKTATALVNHPNNWNNQHLATLIYGLITFSLRPGKFWQRYPRAIPH